MLTDLAMGRITFGPCYCMGPAPGELLCPCERRATQERLHRLAKLKPADIRVVVDGVVMDRKDLCGEV